MKVLCIGDPHFKVSEIPNVEEFIRRCINLCEKESPELIVVLGDVLHEHERIHVDPLNRAYDFISQLKDIAPTYVLVGNHDMGNCSQFLSDMHWMNGMKCWKNVYIVDKPQVVNFHDKKFLFCPYVSPGRFEEALDTSGKDWKTFDCIFAHQEFRGCKMGAIISIEGDEWKEDYPLVISGHIHEKQKPQENVVYPGSAMQHAFGESKKNIILIVDFETNEFREVDLEMPRKRILYKDVSDIDDLVISKTDDNIKVSVSGSYEEFKSLKKTKKYKELINEGVKIVFKMKKLDMSMEEKKYENTDFTKVLWEFVKSKDDEYLSKTYKIIIETN